MESSRAGGLSSQEEKQSPAPEKEQPHSPVHSGGHPTREQVAWEGSKGPGVRELFLPLSTGEAKPGALCPGLDSPEHGDTGESPGKAHKDCEGTGTPFL